MNTSIKRQIIDLARLTPDREICGFIYYTAENELKVYPANNISVNPTNTFEIDPVDYIRCDRRGTICGVYHSHPGNEEAFSKGDLKYIEEVGVPLYLYTVGTGKWSEYIPATYHVDLVGLPFIWGLYDCYSIVRNKWRQDLGIFLDDFDRGNDFAQNDESKPLIVNNLAEQGGVIVGRGMDGLAKAKSNDLILFNTESYSRIFPLHFGVFLGNSRFLHHPEGKLSREDFLDEHWIKRVNLVVRHKSLADSV